MIKIQCRITQSCRIGFAVGVWFGCFASLPLQELQQRNISYFNKQKQKILMFCFALIFNVCGNWSTAAKFFTMRVQSELAFKVLDLNTAFTKMEGVRSGVSESCCISRKLKLWRWKCKKPILNLSTHWRVICMFVGSKLMKFHGKTSPFQKWANFPPKGMKV